MNSRATVILTVTLATACGSGAGANPQVSPGGRLIDAVRVDHAGVSTVLLEREDQITSGRIEGSVSDAWTHLVAVYADLGFETGRLSEYAPAARRVAYSGRANRIGGERLSTYLECGRSMTAPLADQGNVTVFVSTWLEADGDATRILTRFEAAARDAGTSTAAIPCSSRGRLEQVIANHVQYRILVGS